MAVHLGYERAGWPGLVGTGLAFIVPATLMVLGFAWPYVRYGAIPAVSESLVGVKAVMVAIIVDALLRLGRKAIRDWLAVGLLVAVIVLLCGGGVACALAREALKHGHDAARPAWLALLAGAPSVAATAGLAIGVAAFARAALVWKQINATWLIAAGALVRVLARGT